MKWLSVLILCIILSSAPNSYASHTSEEQNINPALSQNWESEIEPILETALSEKGPVLALKHFSHPGAQPVLLIHGLGSNDRIWDSPVTSLSFARFLHSQKFDVWVGNMRGAGTEGFRSDTPAGPHHWNVEDYAIYDVPSLIDRVRSSTGQNPWILVHSLGAWAMEGYLSGLSYDRFGAARPDWTLGQKRQSQIRGVISLAGIYNVWWPHSIGNMIDSPIRSESDYYHSNYELELLARVKPLYKIVYGFNTLPLSWVGKLLNLPFTKIPWIGSKLHSFYQGFTSSLIASPLLSTFYYARGADPDAVRHHGLDGLEEVGPRLLEQLANALINRKTTTYYHLKYPAAPFEYQEARRHIKLPLLFIGGGRDRLASSEMIFQDGYEKYDAPDKRFMNVEYFGHLDIINGLHARKEVMEPVVKWILEHS